MGAILVVQGLRDLSEDSKLQKMKKAKEACDTAGISYPKEVEEYFGDALGYTDLDTGIEDEMLNVEIPKCEFRKVGIDGYEIQLKDIPKEVKTIRVYNSY